LRTDEGFRLRSFFGGLTSASQDLEEHAFIELLIDLGAFKSEYPPDLLATRRAAFISAGEGWERTSTEHPLDPAKQSVQYFNEKIIVLQVPIQLHPPRWGRLAVLYLFQKMSLLPCGIRNILVGNHSRAA